MIKNCSRWGAALIITFVTACGGADFIAPASVDPSIDGGVAADLLLRSRGTCSVSPNPALVDSEAMAFGFGFARSTSIKVVIAMADEAESYPAISSSDGGVSISFVPHAAGPGRVSMYTGRHGSRLAATCAFVVEVAAPQPDAATSQRDAALAQPDATPPPADAAMPSADAALPLADAALPQADAGPAGPAVAFAGAEGFGSQSVGGRGGAVFEVTSLSDSGAGSLRECIEASGPRVCVFRIGGTIALSSGLVVTNPYLTIAGQTAPGGGITLRNDSFSGSSASLQIKTHDVVVRFLALRPGPPTALVSDGDALLVARQNGGVYNVVIDHCSFSWGVDEVLSTWYDARDLTIQWSIISEGLDCSMHVKGCHSKGALLGGYAANEQYTGTGAQDISFHHNLLAHAGERGPMVKTSGVCDVVNNVSYNPYWTFSYVDMTSQTVIPVNYVGNFFKYGPDSDRGKYEIKVVDNGGLGAAIYVAGNIGPHRTSDAQPEADVVESSSRGRLVSTQHPVAPVTATAAAVAYEQVLAQAGAGQGLGCDGRFFVRRDAIDSRIASDVRNGTGRIIDDPSEVGGWLMLAAGTPCADADHDGLADVWEAAHGFDPGDAGDAAGDRDGDGYSNLEEYLNGTAP